MSFVDWGVLIAFLVWVVVDGLRRRTHASADDYFLAGRRVTWWAAGLSIMATQASAITMVGTTGQGWREGLRFIQFYFALPLAMILIAVFVVPVLHRTRVATAYEYLGVRFDAKTRGLAAVLFLVLRGLSVGFVILAPSLVLSKIWALPLEATIVGMGGAAVLYTTIGGLGAVVRTDVKQMIVMVIGLTVSAFMLSRRVDVGDALVLAEASGHLTAIDFRFDPSEKYTVWSSLIGGLFLFLAYFGTDQSQVQRLVAARSVRAARGALLLNAVAKIPFQLLVLGCGVLLFAYYVERGTPVTFEPTVATPAHTASVPGGPKEDATAADYRLADAARQQAARALLDDPHDTEKQRAFAMAHGSAQRLRVAAREARGGESDVNYVFLDFILRELPIGLIGLMLAAILAAALSSIDSEINAMATVAVLDFERLFRRRRSAARAVTHSRWVTAAIGAFATGFACWIARIDGSLIEEVNRVGSYFYGALLGAFVLAWFPRANGHGAFCGVLAALVAVTIAAELSLAFLYLNAVGVVAVVAVGLVVSTVGPAAGERVAG